MNHQLPLQPWLVRPVVWQGGSDRSRWESFLESGLVLVSILGHPWSSMSIVYRWWLCFLWHTHTWWLFIIVMFILNHCDEACVYFLSLSSWKISAMFVMPAWFDHLHYHCLGRFVHCYSRYKTMVVIALGTRTMDLIGSPPASVQGATQLVPPHVKIPESTPPHKNPSCS